MQTGVLNINSREKTEGILSSFLVVSMLILGIAYIYLINTTVFLINARTEAEDNASQIEAELAIWETDYLAAQAQIDLPFAVARGFVEAPKDSTFAYRLNTPNNDRAVSLSR